MTLLADEYARPKPKSRGRRLDGNQTPMRLDQATGTPPRLPTARDLECAGKVGDGLVAKSD